MFLPMYSVPATDFRKDIQFVWQRHLSAVNGQMDKKKGVFHTGCKTCVARNKRMRSLRSIWLADTPCDPHCPSTGAVCVVTTSSLYIEGNCSFDSNMAHDNGGNHGPAQYDRLDDRNVGNAPGAHLFATDLSSEYHGWQITSMCKLKLAHIA